jgi:hypothetical protein
VKATFDHSADQPQLCADPEMAKLRKLLQLSLTRLYNNCREIGPKANLDAFPSLDCRKAARGEPPPVVGFDTNIEDWARHPGETEDVYNLRILVQNHYRFEIIDNAPDASLREVLTQFKAEVKTAFGNLADRQPPEDRFLLNFVGEPAFNFISYSPPPREYHILLGELVEAGGSLALTDWLRAHAALTIRRPQDLFSEDHGDFALAPLAGLEFEPKGLSGALLQPRLGMRAGYQLTPADGWGARVCAVGENCSRFVMEPYLATTVYERLRLQVAEQILPATRAQPVNFDFFIQLGIEFTP